MNATAADGARELIRAASAGLCYAILTFAVGFVLGTIRVLGVAPRLGPTLGVLLETPVILAASWWISQACAARFHVSRALAARLVMGLVAFIVLMLAEVALAAVLYARPIAGYLASLTTLSGAIGLAGQLAFAAFPLLQARVAGPPPGARQASHTRQRRCSSGGRS